MAAERDTHSGGIVSGGIVKPVYSEREMRCLIVSESELKQIGLANLGVTIFTSIGSALMSFSIDITKDVALSPPAQQATMAVAQAVDRFTFWGGICCFAVAAALWFWRHDMIKTIRLESRDSSSGEGH